MKQTYILVLLTALSLQYANADCPPVNSLELKEVTTTVGDQGLTGAKGFKIKSTVQPGWTTNKILVHESLLNLLPVSYLAHNWQDVKGTGVFLESTAKGIVTIVESQNPDRNVVVLEDFTCTYSFPVNVNGHVKNAILDLKKEPGSSYTAEFKYEKYDKNTFYYILPWIFEPSDESFTCKATKGDVTSCPFKKN